MKILLLKILATVAAGLLLLIPALRGFYLLHHDDGAAADRGHRFLLAVSHALEQYAEDHGGLYPERLDAVPLPDRSGIGIENVWSGVLRAPLGDFRGAVRAVRAGRVLDPWGRPWLYRTDPRQSMVRLESYGADRAPGGVGLDADLILTIGDGETTLTSLGDEPLW